MLKNHLKYGHEVSETIFKKFLKAFYIRKVFRHDEYILLIAFLNFEYLQVVYQVSPSLVFPAYLQR